MENRFTEIMSRRTDAELIRIVTSDREQYETLAIESAEREIERRNIDVSEIEKIKVNLNTEIEQQLELETNTATLFSRLLNLVADTFAVMFLAMIVTALDYLLYKGMHVNPQLINIAILLFSFFGYYIFMEYRYQKTLGKFITKTKVTNLQGAKPLLSDIIRRTFFRLVPLDAFSFIFIKDFFHDYLSKTKVVKDSYRN